MRFFTGGGAFLAIAAFVATTAQAVVIVDAPLTTTSQLVTASNTPIFGGFTENLAGVSLFYQAGSASGPADSVNGVFFDNVQFPVGGVPPTGPLALTRNGAPKTLTVNAPWGSGDANPRFQAAGTTGPDFANLNLVTNEFVYLGAPGCCGGAHEGIGLNFGSLGANRNVYVQLIGGDQGWNGDIGVTANGSPAGTWTTVANTDANSASIFGFTATTNATGNLNLDLGVIPGSTIPFAGIAGVVILGETTFAQAPLTNTSQITTLGRTLAAANLFYPQAQGGVVAPGTVNGIQFVDIAFDVAGPQALGGGASITVTPALGGRARFQDTAGTISGRTSSCSNRSPTRSTSSTPAM